MFHHRLDEDGNFKIYFNWFLLSFLSGNVNAGGYLSCHRFVTHVTGFATLVGVDVADSRFDQAIGIFSVPLYFLMGVMVSAFWVDRRIHLGKRPRYDLVMLFVFLCLSAAGVLGSLEQFGRFGDVLRLKQDYFLLALLCLASGLQNAAITTASGATVRTTHLTGITTDLGIGLVRSWYTSPESANHRRSIRNNWLRLGSISSFLGGSIVGAVLFTHVHFQGFLLPAGIAFYSCMIAVFTRRQIERVNANHLRTY